MFWPERDANPFFHLYEALWMLAGRNDVAPLERYVKKSIDYSDDGKTLHGAYGYRWRREFSHYCRRTGVKDDQLEVIASRLKENPEDRRCVLQMWDTRIDLDRQGKDVPCNTIATFQRGIEGELNLVVFNRSNDIIWGCYGANVVQFSFLLEYMAAWIGCPIGTYTQVSVNWHAYDNEVWKQVSAVRPDRMNHVSNPYQMGASSVRHIPMADGVADTDHYIKVILNMADTGVWKEDMFIHPWPKMVYHVLKAHHVFKTETGSAKYLSALHELTLSEHTDADWVSAAGAWILRRYSIWNNKQNLLSGNLEHP